MRTILSILFILAIGIFSSCGIKEQCEQNHEGDICVANYSGNSVEVYINDVFAFDLEDNTINCATKPVGTYNVRFINLDEENIVSVSVEECEDTQVNVSF
jgi:hypothetical protein